MLAKKEHLRWLILVPLLTLCGCTGDRFEIHTESSTATDRTERAESFYVSDSGHPIVVVRMNGIPGRFVIDTGASRSFISREYAEKAGALKQALGSVKSTSRSSKMELAIARISAMSIGTLRISNYDLVVLPDKSEVKLQNSGIGKYCDGMLGADVLLRFGAIVDFAEKTIQFGRRDPRIHPEAGRVVTPLKMLPQFSEIVIKIDVDGRQCWFQVDTGASKFGGVFSASPLRNILRGVDIAPYVKWADFRPHIVTSHLVAKKITIGGVMNTNVEFDIDDDDPPTTDRNMGSVDGTLGSGFLLKNGLIIDYPKMEIRLRSSAQTLAPIVSVGAIQGACLIKEV